MYKLLTIKGLIFFLRTKSIVDYFDLIFWLKFWPNISKFSSFYKKIARNLVHLIIFAGSTHPKTTETIFVNFRVN